MVSNESRAEGAHAWADAEVVEKGTLTPPIRATMMRESTAVRSIVPASHTR
jgi:hypothetical protein